MSRVRAVYDIPPLLQVHLAYLRRGNARPATIEARRDVLLRLTAALPVPLHEATAADLDVWQASLGVTPSSVVTYSSHVRAFFRWAYEEGKLPTNPADRLILPRLDRRLPRPIPERDLKLALATARGDLVLILVMAGFVGLRASEIAAITREDVLHHDELDVLLVHGKAGKERAVPLAPEVLALLQPKLEAKGRIFRTPTGLPADGNFITRVVSEHMHAQGLPYTAHTLRHRFGTVVYGLCLDLRRTGELMGHAKPDTTALYVAVDARAAADTVRQLGAQLPEHLVGVR